MGKWYYSIDNNASKPLNIIEQIKIHNNNQLEILNLIFENGYYVTKGLVYSLDEDTVVKRIYINEDPTDAIKRVNHYVPGFIKRSERVSNNQLVLYLKKYKGKHPHQSSNLINNKDFALQVLQTCLDFREKLLPYTMSDFCTGNILIDGENINIVDLDQLFNGDEDKLPPESYYSKMHWLHKWVNEEEFLEIWNKRF